MTPLGSNHPSQPLFVRCDVGDESAVGDAVEAVVSSWGRIDVLVNCAGVARFATFDALSIDELRRQLDVNFLGYVRFIKAVLPHMRSQGKGFIKNLTSTVGIGGGSDLAGYASSKGAIDGLTRTLRLELERHGIHVTLVYPPPTRTTATLPLGVPPVLLADPKAVGQKLAAKLFSPRPVITPGLRSALLWYSPRLFPVVSVKVLDRLTRLLRVVFPRSTTS